METEPINLDGIEQLIRRKERMMLEEGQGLLDAEDFLQVLPRYWSRES